MGMELIPHPLALPGCCFKCRVGSESRDFFIDFDFSMDDFGAIIICDACVTEMAHAAGFITPTEASKYKQQNQDLLIENQEYLIRIEGLEQAIDGLRLAGVSSRTYSEHHDSVDEQPTTVGSQAGESDVEPGTGEVTKPLHDTKMDGLRPDESTSEFTGFNLNL